MGATLFSDRLVEPFIDSDRMFLHGMTYGGHPVGCAVALANIGILEDEDLPGRVRQHEGAFLRELKTLEDLPIVGDIRGAGYFYGIELVKDKETQGRFSARGVHTPPARLPVAPDLRAGPDLPRRGQERARHPARAAAGGRPGGVRGDHGDSAPGAYRGLGRSGWLIVAGGPKMKLRLGPVLAMIAALVFAAACQPKDTRPASG